MAENSSLNILDYKGYFTKNVRKAHYFSGGMDSTI